MNTAEREREHWRLSKRLTSQFASRKDIHARQLDDGRYWFIKRPFTPGLMYLHMKGEVTAHSGENDHSFRLMPITQSDGSRSPNPMDGDQLGRRPFIAERSDADRSMIHVRADQGKGVRVLRMDSPFSSRRWAWCTSRSRIASARVGLGICACQSATGIWVAIRVDVRP